MIFSTSRPEELTGELTCRPEFESGLNLVWSRKRWRVFTALLFFIWWKGFFVALRFWIDKLYCPLVFTHASNDFGPVKKEKCIFCSYFITVDSFFYVIESNVSSNDQNVKDKKMTGLWDVTCSNCFTQTSGSWGSSGLWFHVLLIWRARWSVKPREQTLVCPAAVFLCFMLRGNSGAVSASVSVTQTCAVGRVYSDLLPACAQASTEELKCAGRKANLTLLRSCGEWLVLVTYLWQTRSQNAAGNERSWGGTRRPSLWSESVLCPRQEVEVGVWPTHACRIRSACSVCCGSRCVFVLLSGSNSTSAINLRKIPIFKTITCFYWGNVYFKGLSLVLS